MCRYAGCDFFMMWFCGGTYLGGLINPYLRTRNYKREMLQNKKVHPKRINYKVSSLIY